MVQELLPLYDNCKEGVFFVFFKHEQNSSRKVGTLVNCKLQKTSYVIHNRIQKTLRV